MRVHTPNLTRWHTFKIGALAEMETPAWVQAGAAIAQLVAMLILVGVTWYYARKTADISSATKAQAEASRQLVELTRQIAQGDPELTLWSVPHTVGKSGVSVNIQNCGKGPARNIHIECWWREDPKTFYFLYDGPSSLNHGDTRLFDCRPVANHLPTALAIGDFVAKVQWQGFDGRQHGPRIETAMNEQMRAFRTNFVDELKKVTLT